MAWAVASAVGSDHVQYCFFFVLIARALSLFSFLWGRRMAALEELRLDRNLWGQNSSKARQGRQKNGLAWALAEDLPRSKLSLTLADSDSKAMAHTQNGQNAEASASA